jgi:septal ring factor EnvC (AmiA/AmiB activator)
LKFQKNIQEWIRVGLLLLLIVACAAPLAAQNRRELEEKRKQLIKEIEETNARLKETQQNKAATLERYLALQQKVRKRRQLVQTLKKELENADSSIARTQEVIVSLEEDIDDLKQEYARTIQTAYRLKINKGMVLFLFSARDINDAFGRWQYVRQYNKYRKRQASLIIDTQSMLEDKAEQMQRKKLEKEQLLASQEQQSTLLRSELIVKDRLLKDLKSSESRLAAALEKQEKAHQRLNEAIEKVIREEVAKMKKAARKPEAVTVGTSENKKVTDAASLSMSFSQLKGSLPWPVEVGEITKYFGTQPHPTLKTIQIKNNGIDIKTKSAAKIHAVYEGIVAGRQYIPGYQNTLILQHGDYYTVYSNLEEVYVKRGDKVNARQAIGKLSGSKNEVHFEIWQEKKRLNPIHWVVKK